MDFIRKHTDAGASINTQNTGNSSLIIEELDWGGQDALNTCENSFFGPHLGLGRQTIVVRLGQTPDVAILILERFAAGSPGGFVL